MDKATVFTKTAKGITQVNQKSGSISKDLLKVLKLIDGKSNFGQIMEKADVDKMQLEKALNALTKDGYARVFVVRKEEVDPFAEEDDFDFTAPGKMPASTQRVIPGAANDISELVKQQEKTEADKRAREQAHEAARVKAKAEAEARAKLEAEARARQQAEQQAMEQARRAKEAAERAKAELESKLREEEARQRAVAEQQARAAAEQRAKEEAEQRRMAELRAKAEKEANERARADLEAKLREEEAKRKSEAEQQAKAAAAQRAKEEEEQKKLAEMRAKAEREAKALAEARARAEAEAAAMARARAEAEAAAKRKAEEASAAEAQMKARLKEEIEARIRAEMEDLLRSQAAEKAQEKAQQQRSEEEVKREREEMRQQIMEEARLAAKAELEERLRDEREAIARAESEARTRAEQDAKRRADEESKKRAEAEARAAAEAEARIKAEEEARRLRVQAEEQTRRAAETEARAKAEADARARVEQEAAARIEAERRAKFEAEARAKVEAEERAKRERELGATIEAERRAKEEAEMRAKIEARARETVEQDTRARVQAELEGDMTKRAELEGKAQARAYMEAKARAEQEEDEKMRAEQARKAREIADVLRTKVEPDEVAPEPGTPAARKRYVRKKSLAKPLLLGIAILFIVAVGLLHVVPLRPYTQKVERTVGTWIHDEVSIGTMTFRLVPSPHLKIDNVAVGKLLDAKAATGRVYLDLGSLFSDRLSINEIELDGVTINSEAAKRIPAWSQSSGRADAGHIETIQLRGVKMDMKPVPEVFNATLRFRKDGALNVAVLTAGGATATLKPTESGFDIDASARNYTLPLGAPLPVGDVRLKGTWSGSEIVVPEFEADAMEGKVNGTLRISWNGPVRVQSDLSLARVDVKPLVGSFTKAISVTGRVEGNFSIASEAPTLNELFAAPRVQGKFRLSDGSISNVDLVAVMQSDTAGQRAGVTKFAELTGEMASGDGRTAYRNLALQGGVLRGNGAIDVGSGGNLAGRLNLEIRSQVAQDRGTFAVGGTVQRPSIRRGG